MKIVEVLLSKPYVVKRIPKYKRVKNAETGKNDYVYEVKDGKKVKVQEMKDGKPVTQPSPQVNVVGYVLDDGGKKIKGTTATVCKYIADHTKDKGEEIGVIDNAVVNTRGTGFFLAGKPSFYKNKEVKLTCIYKTELKSKKDKDTGKTIKEEVISSPETLIDPSYKEFVKEKAVKEKAASAKKNPKRATKLLAALQKLEGAN